jgi:hypothetical protein
MIGTSMTDATCPSCGAPDNGEFALCHYCSAPFSPEIAASAVPCPACGAHCRSGRERCGACGVWLVVACVFCGAHSPYNVPACLACQEPFAGAPERKAEIDRARALREASAEAAEVIGTVGSILGVVAEAEELANRRRW